MSCKHVDAAGKLIHPFLVLGRVIYVEGQALGKCRATIVLNAGAKTEGYDLFFIPPSPIFFLLQGHLDFSDFCYFSNSS
jgi:hypothetical protein